MQGAALRPVGCWAPRAAPGSLMLESETRVCGGRCLGSCSFVVSWGGKGPSNLIRVMKGIQEYLRPSVTLVGLAGSDLAEHNLKDATVVGSVQPDQYTADLERAGAASTAADTCHCAGVQFASGDEG